MVLFWSSPAAATILSGKFRLDNQAIIISGEEDYYGEFDLRSLLPMGDEFVLSKVIVSFKFQDDKEWVTKAGQSSLEDTGKVIRHGGFLVKRKSIAGQTDHYFTAKNIIHLSNEEEVAKLTIGRNIYFGTTMRRREVVQETIGQKSILLGTYSDDGDDGRIRQHHRITQSVLETHRDGYDGLFEMRHKVLDLAAAQDLAHSGVLEFELSGKGDYIFSEATLQYEGYTTGQEARDDTEGSMSDGMLWFMLLGLAAGVFFWWKKPQTIQKTRTVQKSKPVKNRNLSRKQAF